MHVFEWFLKRTETVEWIFFSNVGRKVSVPPLVEGIGRARELHKCPAEAIPNAIGKMRALAFWISLR
jgi:hypothetical protein